MLTSAVAIAAVLLLPPRPAVADNAATYYVLAADHVHNLWSYEKDELEQVLAVPFDAPPHPDTDKWLRKFDRPLVFLHRGANCRACVWLHDAARMTDPIATLSGDAVNTSRVYSLALVRARVRFAGGRPVEAAADVRAVLRLAHFMRQSGSVGAWIFGNVVEDQVCRCLAGVMGTIPPESAAALRDHFRTAPLPAPAEAVVAGEWRALRGWMAYHFATGKSPAADGYPDHALDPLYEVLADLKLVRDKDALAQIDAAAARWAGRDREVAAAGPAALAVLEKRRHNDRKVNFYTDDTITHALMNSIGPNAGGLRRSEFRSAARLAMITAALDARATGTVPAGGVDRFGQAYRSWPAAGGYVLIAAAGYEDGRPSRLRVHSRPPVE